MLVWRYSRYHRKPGLALQFCWFHDVYLISKRVIEHLPVFSEGAHECKIDLSMRHWIDISRALVVDFFLELNKGLNMAFHWRTRMLDETMKLVFCFIAENIADMTVLIGETFPDSVC